MKLRPYQEQCANSILSELGNGSRSTLAVMPTGTGKTVVFARIAKDWKDGRVLVIAHREELIFQASDKIGRAMNLTPEIEMGELRAAKSGLFVNSHVVVSSVQTQNAGPKCRLCDGSGSVAGPDGLLPCNCLDGFERRMMRFDPHEFGLLIIDEAHHATAQSYKRVHDWYSRNPNIKILGVTATPDRHDEAALGRIFGSVAFEYGILDAINDGWLVPIQQEFVRCNNLDFSRCRTTAGDLNGADLEKVLIEEKALHEVTTPTIEIAAGRPTLVFATSVAHAELMAEIFNRHKTDSAICIHGGTPSEDRRSRLRRYACGEFQFLCGCGVFLEGFDEPRIEVIAMARPTKSRALYAQAVGRGTRPIVPPTAETAEERRAAIAGSAKPGVLVLDFVGNSGVHKLITTADILGGNYEDEIIERAEKNAQKKSGPVDMREELENAEREKLDERRRDEEARRKRESVTASKAEYSRRTIDPFSVFDMAPRREPEYHKAGKPSDKQIALLKRCGLTDRELSGLTKFKASRLIGEVFARRDKGLCTYKQARVLAKYGHATHKTVQEASVIMNQLAANGWQQPQPEPVPF